jgi:hypothetical protein
MRKAALTLLAALVIAGACSSSSDKEISAQTSDAIAKAGDEALALLQKEAATVGQTQLTSVTDGIKPYIDAVVAAGRLVAAKAKEIDDANFNVFVYTALNWAGLRASPTAADQTATVPDLLKEADERKVSGLDRDDLTADVRRFLKWIGITVIYSEKGVTDQVVPPESLLRKEWDKDGDGRLNVPLPPIRSGSDAKAWQDFTSTFPDLPPTEDSGIPDSEVRLAANRFKFDS